MKKEKDSEKEARLLNSGFKLFTHKGFKETSIQEIVDDAKVAKGTFYTYFKDKFELRNVLIARKSGKLFNDAFKALQKTDITKLDEQVIFVIDYIIDVEQNIKLKNPEVTLYMIIELVSSTCFNSILYKEPLPINEFKPYLYEEIKNLIIK